MTSLRGSNNWRRKCCLVGVFLASLSIALQFWTSVSNFKGDIAKVTNKSFMDDHVKELVAGYENNGHYPSDPNLPTFAFARFTKKGQGYFNQQMAFSGAIMMLADWMAKQKTDEYQILLPSLVFLDYLGTNGFVHFERLFDVRHWNTYFPKLPRIVSFNETQHYQYDAKHNRVKTNVTRHDHPRYVKKAITAFQYYHNGYFVGLKNGKKTEMHPADQLILQGALRPAPAVEEAIHRVTQDGNYMAIHLRFEQDFLCYPWKKGDHNLTLALTRIENSVQAMYNKNGTVSTTPPIDRVFVAINRPYLEDGSKMPQNPRPSAEACEAERQDNLAALNRLVRDGMWGGRVPVFERPPLDAQFRDRPVVFGSLIDSEICLRAKIFAGRFSSTFTQNTIRRRSSMGLNESYNYEMGWRKMNGLIFPREVKD